jgi:type II secretion system protein C
MRSFLASSLVLAVGACGGGHSPPAAAPPVPVAPAASAQETAPSPAATRPGSTLSRAAVRALVARGLGAFLQRVEFDDRPVFVGGRFHGFRIAALHDAAFFQGVDLRPGDVVTGVNGLSIERPEQAQSAFESLSVASELHVAYERDGQAHEIVYTIVDDR